VHIVVLFIVVGNTHKNYKGVEILGWNDDVAPFYDDVHAVLLGPQVLLLDKHTFFTSSGFSRKIEARVECLYSTKWNWQNLHSKSGILLVYLFQKLWRPECQVLETVV
jgi:hypothetical protein